jgi:ACT domain-containing protein
MAIKKAVGRPQEFNFKIVSKLADSVSHNYSIGDACKFARISRSTYYYYLNNEPLFAEAMALAHNNQRKVNFNFRTTH